MRPVTLAAVIAAVAATACTDPTIDVVFDYDERTDLRQAITRFELAVYQLSPSGAGAICDQIAFGLLANDLLDPALRSVVRAARPAEGEFGRLRLDDVPRLGPKQFVFTGYDARNQIFGGGCAEVGDLDQDTTVTLPIEPTLIMRNVTREPMVETLTLPTTAEVEPELIAFERYSGAPPTTPGSFRTTLRDDEHEASFGSITPADDPALAADGLHVVSGLDVAPTLGNQPPVGPVELTVYGRWADQSVRIAAVVQPWQIGGFALGAEPNLLAPSWTAFETIVGMGTDSDRVVAMAALYASTTTAPAVHVFRQVAGQVVMEPLGALPLDARALAAWKRREAEVAQLVTLTDTGWVRINLDPLEVQAVSASSDGPAEQLVAFKPCLDGPGEESTIGLIAIARGRAIGVQGPGGLVNAAVTSVAARVQALLDAGGRVTLLGTSCGKLTPNAQSQTPLLAVRVEDVGRDETYFIAPGLPTIKSPFVGPVAVVAIEEQGLAVAGAELTSTGAVVTTYRLRLDPSPRFVPNGEISHPLGQPPVALAVRDVTGDTVPDTLALVRRFGRTAVTFTASTDDIGRPLSSIMLPPEGVDADLDELALLNLVGAPQLVAAGPRGFIGWDLSRAEFTRGTQRR